MYKYLSLIILVIIFGSCSEQKERKSENNEQSSLLEEFNIHKIYTIEANDSTTETQVEVQIYQSLDDKKFVNQAIHYHKDKTIDTLNSYFYRLDFNETSKNNYKGEIWLNYEGGKIEEIEFKTLTYETSEPLISSFVSNNVNTISFGFFNNNSEAPLIGVLCVKIETEVLIGEEITKGYYKRYIFVDSNEITDNLFIKKYKK